MKIETAFFLGAGFSREADLPVMQAFGKYSVSQLKSLINKHAPGAEDPRKVAPSLIENGDLFEAFRQYLREHSPPMYRTFDHNNMEDIFATAEMMRECGQNSIELKGSDVEILRLIAAIKLWLWKIYQRIPIHNPDKYGIDASSYYKFVDIINDYGFDRLSIITTNYDMILEYALHQKKIQCCYPIDESHYNFYDLSKTDKRVACNWSKAKNSPVICKLHGSVNYFANPEDNNGEYLKVIADTAQKKIGESSISKKAPSIMALDAPRLLSKENLFPEIIPPTYAKLHGYAWLRDIWANALEAFVNAQKWIFIGYSLPNSDGFMKSFINTALTMRKKGATPEIQLIDPDCDGMTKANYNRFFGEKNFLHQELRFSEAVNSGFLQSLIV